MSTLKVTNLPVVDFTDPVVRRLFSVSEAALTANDYAACRRLADILRQRPDLFGGFILPSAAVPGEQTLIVFSEWISGHLTVVDSKTSNAPHRLLRLFEMVIGTLSRHLQQDAWRLAKQARREIEAAAKREVERIRHGRR